MASKQPNPNLWAVAFSVDGATDTFNTLLICAANAQTAGNKAKRIIREAGFKRARIKKIEWEGTIDAF